MSPQRAADRKPALLLPALLVVLLPALLLAEGWLPGQLLVPLTPDDFPAWRAGREAASLQPHPHPNFCLSDVLHLLVPGLAVNASAAARSELPLWDDSQALGLPHLHQIHYGVLYPPAWLPLALGWRGLHLMALLHLAVAGLGMLLYLAALGRSRSAAVGGALAFALSAWLTARLQAFPAAGALAWMPWVLWGLERGAQAGGGRRHRAAAALALALSLAAGFPQVSLWVLAVAALVELVRAAVRVARCERWAGTLVAGALTLALGVGLALPQLLPTLQTLREDSLRVEQTPEGVLSERLEAPLLWHLLVPERYATAGLAGPHPLALADLDQAKLPAAVNRAETSFGVGVVGLVLAIVAMVFGRSWTTRTYAALALGGLLVLAVPAVLREAALLCPLLRLGSPKRLLVVVSFALAVLVAGGLDLVRGRRLRVTVTAWALAVAAAGLALASRLSIPSSALPADVERWASRLAESLAQPGLDGAGLLALVPADNFRIAGAAAARSSLLALAAAGFAVLMFRPRRLSTVEGWGTRARRAPQMLVAVLVLELGLSAWPMLRTAPAEAVTPNPSRIGSLRAPALAGLARDAGPAHGLAPRVLRFGNEPSWLRPNFPGLFALADAQAYAPLPPRRYAELLAAADPATAVSGSILGGLQSEEALDSPILDLVAAEVLFADREDLDAPGWVERGRAHPVRVLANEQALPRAFVVPRADVEPDAAARLARLAAPGFDPRAVVLLEEAGPGSGGTALAAGEGAGKTVAAGAPARAATLRRLAPGRLSVEVEAGGPGWLVVSEGWHGGWRARVDGRDAAILRADHALMAVRLETEAGTRVELSFDPPAVRNGLRAGLACGAIVLGLLLPWPRRWRPAPATAARTASQAAALALLALLGACANDEPPPGVLRLWTGELPSTVAGAPGAGGAPGFPAAETLLWECRFDGRDAGPSAPVPWHLVRGELTDERLELQPVSPADGALRVARGEAQAALALLEARPGEALSLRVTLRGEGRPAAHELPLASLVELREPLAPQDGLPTKTAWRMFDSKHDSAHTMPGVLRASARELRTDIVVSRDTAQLALYLLAPRDGAVAALVVERVQLWRRPLMSHVWAGGEVPRLERRRDGIVRIEIDRDEREGLLLLPGGERCWTLPADARPRRLDFALGVMPRHAALEGALLVSVLAGGRPVLERRLTAPPSALEPAWHDLRVELPAADGPLPLVVRARAEGPDPPLAVLGHPTLRTGAASQPDPRPNVVLISLDTLRPDRLGCYGGERGLAPRLDAFAASGLRFDQAYSTSTYTLPSHGSLLTGQYPAVHGAVNVDDRLSASRSPFLARQMAEAGWVTAAFTGGGYVATHYGFGEGFDRYAMSDPVWALDGVRGQQLIETVRSAQGPALEPLLRRYAAPAVLDWIGRQDDGRPFLLFLHTYIAHNYAPDRDALARRGLLGPGGAEEPFDHRDRARFNEGADLPAARVAAQYLPYYDATIGMADRFVGQVLDALEAAGLDERTIVVVTSDHGEEFGEHGFFGHGETLYDGNARVPLLVRLPAQVAARAGLAQPAVHEAPVSLVDVAPFVLRLAGLAPDPRMTIRQLAPEREMPPERSTLFVELDTRISEQHTTRLSAVRGGPLKLHALVEGRARGMASGEQRLYDLAADPGERRDLRAARDAEAVRLRGLLDSFHDLAGAIHPRDGAQPVDLDVLSPELREELEGMGYLTGPDAR